MCPGSGNIWGLVGPGSGNVWDHCALTLAMFGDHCALALAMFVDHCTLALAMFGDHCALALSGHWPLAQTSDTGQADRHRLRETASRLQPAAGRCMELHGTAGSCSELQGTAGSCRAANSGLSSGSGGLSYCSTLQGQVQGKYWARGRCRGK